MAAENKKKLKKAKDQDQADKAKSKAKKEDKELSDADLERVAGGRVPVDHTIEVPKK